ncbi:MAG: hypothetical protein JEZ08_25455 [Clostridiales bacterium]|nr:hypothetical protein [Clostridiales bacterium]
MRKIYILIILVLLLNGCANSTDNQMETNENHISLIEDYEDEIDLLNKQIDSLIDEKDELVDEINQKVDSIKALKIKVEDIDKKNIKLISDNIEATKMLDFFLKKVTDLRQLQSIGMHNMYIGDQIKDKGNTEYNPFYVAVGTDWRNDTVTRKSFFMGGSSEEGWFNLYDFYLNGEKEKRIDLIKENDTYNVYSFNRFIGNETIFYPKYYDSVAIDDTQYTFQSDTSIGNDEKVVVGINCKWSPQPRIPRILHETGDLYIDIDGDGIEELIKRKEVIVDDHTIWFADYLNKDIDGNDLEKTNWIGYVFLDLNGDNKLELIEVYLSNTGYGIIISEYIDNRYIVFNRYDLGD